MTLEELYDGLSTARDLNGGHSLQVVDSAGDAWTVVDVEVGIYTGDVVLRVEPVEL